MFYLAILLMSAFILLLFLLTVSLVLAEKGFLFEMREECTSYECGFEHNSLSRIPFSIRYFLLTVVFLIFDLEIVLLVFMPFSLSGSIMNSFLVLVSLSFLLLLFLGLIYEWIDGSLDWVM